MSTPSGETCVVDANGLLCPLPVIRTQDAVKGRQAGERVLVHATDPGTMHDIPAWCRVHGHELVRAEDTGERRYEFEIVVR